MRNSSLNSSLSASFRSTPPAASSSLMCSSWRE